MPNPSRPMQDGYRVSVDAAYFPSINGTAVPETDLASASQVCKHCNHNTHASKLASNIDNQKMAVCLACWAKEHYTNCTNCRNTGRVGKELTSIVDRSGHWCHKCIGRHVFVCTKCNHGFLGGDYGLQGSCLSCLKTSRCSPDKKTFKIMGHDYRPETPRFYGEPANNLFFGMELELEVLKGHKKDVAFKLTRAMEETYAVHDGSISFGFEVVTHPMSYDYLVKEFNLDYIEKLGKDKIACSWRKTCGMHFHLSKCAFSPLHRYKFLRFFYQNQDFCEVIGQRKFNQYCKKAQSCHKDALEKAYYKRQGDRYEFINLQNPYTIELRFFKGNLLRERILKNLEFIKAAYEYTKMASVFQLDTPGFLKYVEDNKGAYKHLSKFCKKRSIANASWEVKTVWTLPDKVSASDVYTNLGPFDWNNGNYLPVPWPKFQNILNVGPRVIYPDKTGKERVFKCKDEFLDFYNDEAKYTVSNNLDKLNKLYQMQDLDDKRNTANKRSYPDIPKLSKPSPDSKYAVITRAEKATPEGELDIHSWNRLCQGLTSAEISQLMHDLGQPMRASHVICVRAINWIASHTSQELPNWALPYISHDTATFDPDPWYADTNIGETL